jgi:predicted lipid-binding transport protein (Tim44 family)
MSIRKISSQHSATSARADNPRPVARERSINPLWMVTFAAGLLFGLLAALLTSG